MRIEGIVLYQERFYCCFNSSLKPKNMHLALQHQKFSPSESTVCVLQNLSCRTESTILFDKIKHPKIHSYVKAILYYTTKTKLNVDCCKLCIWQMLFICLHWCEWGFAFAIYLGAFRYEFYSEFSTFVILLFIQCIYENNFYQNLFQQEKRASKLWYTYSVNKSASINSIWIT